MLQIYPIPAFDNNYFWLIQPNSEGSSAFIVDPGDPQPVRQALHQRGLQLSGILLTHHHLDHIGGATALAEDSGAPIYGPRSAKIPQVTHHVAEGDHIHLGGLTLRVMAIPGHTLDHIAYYLPPEPQRHSPGRLFSADTLFACGCGRIFDGSAELLYAALARIAALPEDTLIYAAHEYTQANIRFALFIEPENADLIARRHQVDQLRAENQPTLPTRLDLELKTNPFLRCHCPAVWQRAEQLAGHKLENNVEIFATLRRSKDSF